MVALLGDAHRVDTDTFVQIATYISACVCGEGHKANRHAQADPTLFDMELFLVSQFRHI